MTDRNLIAIWLAWTHEMDNRWSQLQVTHGYVQFCINNGTPFGGRLCAYKFMVEVLCAQ